MAATAELWQEYVDCSHVIRYGRFSMVVRFCWCSMNKVPSAISLLEGHGHCSQTTSGRDAGRLNARRHISLSTPNPLPILMTPDRSQRDRISGLLSAQ